METLARKLVLLALLFGATAGASDDVAAIIGYARQGEAPMPGAAPGATVAAKEHFVSLYWTVDEKDRREVTVGLDYQYTRYDYSGINSRDRDLHRLTLPVRLEHDRGDRVIRAYLAPGIATSSNIFKDFFNRGSSDDWYLSGAVEAQLGRPGRQWLVGIAYDRSFGKDGMYPILGVRLSPRDDVDVRLAYPVSEIAWRKTGKTTLTGRVMPAGFEWRVVTDDFADEFDYHVEGLRTQIHWTRRIFARMSIDLSATYETNRKHDLVNSAGDRVIGYPQDEWLFAAALVFGLPGDDGAVVPAVGPGVLTGQAVNHGAHAAD